MTYQREIAQAKRMIEAKGEVCTLIKTLQTQDTDKPWKGSAAGDNPQETTVKMVFFPPKRTGIYAKFQLINNTPQMEGGVRAYMAAVYGVVPKPGDKLTRASDPTNVYTIDYVDPLSPNGEDIYYELELSA